MQEDARQGVEGVPEGTGGGENRPLWRAYSGAVRLDALEPHCVIDRCAAETGVLTFRVRGGGERTAGLRPRAIDPGILANNRNFFQSLRASIAESGVKVPILVWAINGKLWVRYGASRVHTCLGLGFRTAPALLCSYDANVPAGFLAVRELRSPADVLAAFGPPSQVGHFVVDHEKIDAHRMEP